MNNKIDCWSNLFLECNAVMPRRLILPRDWIIEKKYNQTLWYNNIVGGLFVDKQIYLLWDLGIPGPTFYHPLWLNSYTGNAEEIYIQYCTE